MTLKELWDYDGNAVMATLEGGGYHPVSEPRPWQDLTGYWGKHDFRSVDIEETEAGTVVRIVARAPMQIEEYEACYILVP